MAFFDFAHNQTGHAKNHIAVTSLGAAFAHVFDVHQFHDAACPSARARLEDGSSYGTFETSLHDWFVGMEFRATGNRLMRICSIAPDVNAWIVEPVEPGQVSNGD